MVWIWVVVSLFGCGSHLEDSGQPKPADSGSESDTDTDTDTAEDALEITLSDPGAWSTTGSSKLCNGELYDMWSGSPHSDTSMGGSPLWSEGDGLGFSYDCNSWWDWDSHP
jgi:hypothetical protein